MWRKALIVAACVELPVVVIFAIVSHHPGLADVTRRILVWYHVVPVTIFTFPLLAVSSLFSGASWLHRAWYFVEYTVMYAGQVAVTTPIVYYILKFRAGRSSPT